MRDATGFLFGSLTKTADHDPRCPFTFANCLTPTLHWRLVIAANNAPTLAGFWAAALEYRVEDTSPLIEQLLAAGHISDDAIVEHRGRKIFRGSAAIRHADDPFDATSAVTAWLPGGGPGLRRR